jgi:tetratricopeptide (TPR) repeat protein
VGISRTLESEGQYDHALEVIDKTLKEVPDEPDLLARRAELLYQHGRWDEAEKTATQALAKKDDHFLARWILGQALRDRGELDKADEEFRWFVRTYTQRSNNDMEIKDPDLLVLVGLAASERARWHHLADQFQFILDDVYAEAAKNDKDFWWAEYEAGRLFLEKYNKAGAERAFTRALTINPRAAEALAYKGMAAMQRLEIKDADQYAEQALEINPRLTMALRLKADVHLFGGELSLALKVLENARAVNPRDEQTLARLAACFQAMRKDAEFAALVKEVEKHNPKPAIFYYELAESVEGRKLYHDAEKYFRQSIDLQPKLPWAQNGLGLLYMRLGKEDEARKILDKAFDADSFNVRVSNTLKVLDHLAKYETIKTEHFLLRFDPKNDKVLANFLAKYLEDIYEELAEKFQYRPKGPILIEVFNKHEMFSGRVVALPDLHTIGACTGSVVAMVSPRDKSKIISKPFNWNRVMRHELVHVFNLDQTGFQIPHWLTEGLAVTMEGTGTPPRWHSLLAEKMQAGELLNLDNILLGFVRPRSPDEWQLAYLQSQLYVEYLTKEHGDKAIGALLAAFAEGLGTASALEKAVNVKKDAFEKGYRTFLEDRVAKNAGPAAQKVLTFKKLKEANANDPDDADIAAQLADRYYQIGNKKEARKLADKVLTAKGKHPLAAYVKAMLLNDAGDSDVALSLLETNVDDKTTDPKPLRLLAKFQMESKKFTEAARTYEQARKADPHDPAWLVALGKLYLKSGDEARLIDIFKEIARLDPDDLLTRRKLAQVYLKEGKLADAETYARQALEIDVLDQEAQQVLLDALRKQNKEKEVKELQKLLGD